MASLFKRNGIYYTEFYDASRVPKSKRFSLKTRSKPEARKRLSDLERDSEKGIFDAWRDDPNNYKRNREVAGPIRIDEAVTEFLEDKRESGRSESTLRNYESFCMMLARRVGLPIPAKVDG